MTTNNLWIRFRNEPYLFINFFFAGVILLIFIYSGIFSPEKNNYPVTCIHEQITGQKCISCGLSHSFSLIVRGRIHEALMWNAYSIYIFLFFLIELVLRIIFSILYIKFPATGRQLVIFDCVGSGLIFLLTFWPFIASIFRAL